TSTICALEITSRPSLSSHRIRSVPSSRCLVFRRKSPLETRLEAMQCYRKNLLRAVCARSADFLGESNEKPFRPADVAKPIRVFILDYVAYELRAALEEPFKRLVDVVHREHDAEVAEGVDRGVPVIGDDRRREEAGELEAGC